MWPAGVDPESESGNQQSWTPYHFSFNNPILNSDPDGRNPIVVPLYALYRVVSIGWRILRTLEKTTPEGARSFQQLKAAESGRMPIGIRDNVPTAIKPILVKTGDKEAASDQRTAAQKRADKLSEKDRPGQDFTKAGKDAVIDVNKEQNGGKTVCETCGKETIPAAKDVRGVAPPKNRTEIDHIDKRRDGGSGTPNNGRVRCRGCNNNDDRPIKN